MTVAIVGSPGYEPLGHVCDYIATLPQGTKVVAGGWTDVARIATWTASRVAGLPVTVSYQEYPAVLATADRVAVFWDGHDMEIQDVFMAAIADGKPVSIFYESGKVVRHD